MEWSPQQTQALDNVGQWLRERNEPVFSVFGYAGTGKTTLAIHFAQGAGNVLFASYTGKAASVMRKCGCPNASTIHQLIYLPAEKSKVRLRELEEQLWELLSEQGPDPAETTEIKRIKLKIEEEKKRLKRPSFVLNSESPVRDADLVVIDECSMVDERIGNDLLYFGTPVLVLGDPAQLPPVKGGGFFTNRRPDVMLTEIHRQARDNPIIDLATRIRMGEGIPDGTYGDSLVMHGMPDQELVTKADQILVGKNDSRRRCNSRMRSLLGCQGAGMLPVPGDKLVCLRNDHMAGLLNGTIWFVRESSEIGGDEISLEIENEPGGSNMLVDAHTHYFEGRENELPFWRIREAQCFDYGYALTVHKAQGSQWPSVFVFDESHVFPTSRNNWLYTAVTRASEKVVICRS